MSYVEVSNPTASVREEIIEKEARVITGKGEPTLGRTLIDLLQEAVEKYARDNAFNQQTPNGWQPMSTQTFDAQTSAMAVALNARGIHHGDRVALYNESDLTFCLADMACLKAGIIDVPLYLTDSHEAFIHILKETEAKALFSSSKELCEKILPALTNSQVKLIILQDTTAGLPTPETNSLAVPNDITVLTSEMLLAEGEALLAENPQAIETLTSKVSAQDLATIIYTSGTTGIPKGVMLTHENISSNVQDGFNQLEMSPKNGDTVMSILPLTHIFARMLQYGNIWYVLPTYFSSPQDVAVHLLEIKPSYMAAVPRVFERIYENILTKGATLTGWKKFLFDNSVNYANNYDLLNPPTGLQALLGKVYDLFVFSKWRAALGNIDFMVSGGAPLRKDLVNIFAAAKIKICEGYGLTETSPVITVNNRNPVPGTVGLPLAGIMVKIGAEGEVLTKGPQVMKGYYKKPEETARVLKDGWFYTGDSGELDEAGRLSITGRIKHLFKLSTGKYVMPNHLEQKIEKDSIVDIAMVVGRGEKYASALLFVSPESTIDEAFQQQIKEICQEANKGEPHWSTVKRVAIINAELSIDDGFLTPTLKLRRKNVMAHYGNAVEAIYDRPIAQNNQTGFVVLEIESLAQHKS